MDAALRVPTDKGGLLEIEREGRVVEGNLHRDV